MRVILYSAGDADATDTAVTDTAANYHFDCHCTQLAQRHPRGVHVRSAHEAGFFIEAVRKAAQSKRGAENVNIFR